MLVVDTRLTLGDTNAVPLVSTNDTPTPARNPEPAITTKVPPSVVAVVGNAFAMVGSGTMYEYAALSEARWPSTLMISTSTVPAAARAGAVQCMLVGPTKVTS